MFFYMPEKNMKKGENMKKILFSIVILLIFLANFAYAVELIDESSWKDDANFEENNAKMQHGIKMLCIDGHKFLYAFAHSSALHISKKSSTVADSIGVGSSSDISIIQVYTEKDGKVIPAQCLPSKK